MRNDLTPNWRLIGLLLCLEACAPAAPSPPAKDAFQAKLDLYQCAHFRGTDYAEVCYVRFAINRAPPDAKRIGCYGEIQFTQVIDGSVQQPLDGIYGTTNYVTPRGTTTVALFHYFTADHHALDPQLKWWNCEDQTHIGK